VLKNLVLIGLTLFSLTGFAAGPTLSIALPTSKKVITQKPAADLLINDGDQPRVLEVGEAASLAELGTDLSLLDPVENKLWQNKTYSVSDAEEQSYPASELGVRFISHEAQNTGTAMMRVQSNGNSSKYFRLAVSRFSQSVMMRAALLRKLGYYIPSPKYYKSLKVTFKDEAQKSDFLVEAQKYAGDFDSRKWVIEDNVSGHYVVLASATLEVVSSEFFDIQWGFAPNPDNPDQNAFVQRFSKNRAYRALIFPYALVDVPESVNRYSTQMILIQAGFAVIQNPSAKSFNACTAADAQWLLRKLQKLTLDDYREIVKQAQYPAEIEDLVLAKFLLRAHQSLSVFSLSSNITPLPIDITGPKGLVVKGKVVSEFTPGFPQRFSHGERTSPYNEGDFGRYLSVDFNSSVLATLIAKLNEKLQIATVGDIAKDYREGLINSIISQIRQHPDQPIYREVQSFGGPTAGLNLRAARHIATGTYSGSTAPVQLVDNISVGAGLGYFRALDGLQYFPTMGANFQITRDYTHVRPILSIKEGTKVPWQNILVPKFMGQIAKVLESEEIVTTTGEGADKQQITQKALDQFLLDLRDGEVFTVTDSIGLQAYLQATSSLDVLLGITPFNFVNSVTLGADASRVILRQVQFMRAPDGVHVYVREMKNRGAGLEMNVNFYLNLLKIRSQSSWSDIKTDAFVIDYNPALSIETDPTTEIGKKFSKVRENLRMALLPLLKSNETEVLYSKFKNNMFALNHVLKTEETKLKFLAEKYNQFSEEHLLTLQYPRSEEHPELDPKDEEVTLFSFKQGKLKGRDLLGMFFDLLDGVFSNKKKDITLSRAMGENPANMPFGNAYWTTVNSEADLTVNGTQYSSISMIQHVWGGWSMGRDKFLSLIDEIQNEFTTSGIAPYKLIDKNALINVKSLDFYRITANLSVLDSGLARVQELLAQEESQGRQAPKASFFLSRFFQKISEAGGNKARVGDLELFNEMMRVLGNGDLAQGQWAYAEACRAAGLTGDHGSQVGTAWLYGTNYSCLTDWMRKLIQLSRQMPSDKKSRTIWLTKVLVILDEQIPMPMLLKFLGEENYLFFVRVNGFRKGDEDGDLEFYSNTFGDPSKKYEEAGGLFNLYAKKTRITPVEVDRTVGGFQ
jgi:hypothetical protein